MARVCRVIHDLNAVRVVLCPAQQPEGPRISAVLPDTVELAEGQMLPLTIAAEQCLSCEM